MSKNILVVNDVPGIGKVAGNINLPVLSALELETSILPTLILSSQTGQHYPSVITHSMGPSFAQILSVWEENRVEFDAYLTGYFANSDQMDTFTDYYQRLAQSAHRSYLIVDPVMGDKGQLYQNFDQEMIETFRGLMSYADIVLPNSTEVSLLSGMPYQPNFSIENYREMAAKIQGMGHKNLVITGVKFSEYEDKIGFLLFNEAYPLGKYYAHRYYSGDFFGTGDLVASVISGLYTWGVSIEDILGFVGPIVEQVIEATLNCPHREPQRGLKFEGILGQLAQCEFKRKETLNE